ncbi:MAG: hypothetical protein DI589_04855 [Shinella sp.]|nr:MAG: hypothetical protein DI589_04855 [Shinella sp.]
MSVKMISSAFRIPSRTIHPSSTLRDAETEASATGALLGTASAVAEEALKSGDLIGALVFLAQNVSRAETVYDVFSAINAYAANDGQKPSETERSVAKL